MADARPALEQLLRDAQGQGLLPPEATLPPEDGRPWPVVLLTAVGAWFAALPLLGTISLLLGDLALRGAAPYLIGALLLAGAAVVLRARGVAIFVEQLAVPALLAGFGTLAFGLGRDLPTRGAAAALCALALGLAGLIPRAWLRALLGALAATLAVIVLSPGRVPSPGHAAAFWLPLHAVLLAGLATWMLQAQRLTQARGTACAALLEPVAASWLAAALVGLAWWSGLSFLAGGLLGGGMPGDIARLLFGRGGAGTALQVASVLLAVLAAGVLGRAWPTLRQPLAALAAAVLALLAAFLPALGGVLLLLAAAALTRRWLLAGLAALVAAWIVGTFYYQLAWPLALKALVLAGAGAVLAAGAWLAQPRRSAPDAAARARFDARPALWIAVACVATLAFANGSIWSKERLIARSDKVYVALAPVDPRSLLQGDYMRLNFNLPEAGPTAALRGRRPFVIARRDARGVAQLTRIGQPGERLAAGEFAMELTPKDGRWTLVSDAWFFPEGDGARWQAARYAEFRVDASGHALLVGLADEALRPIRGEP